MKGQEAAHRISVTAIVHSTQTGLYGSESPCVQDQQHTADQGRSFYELVQPFLQDGSALIPLL